MKLLFIGNSFSQDAGRYLYSLCEAGGVDAEVLNFYIGGCSLERHADCFQNGKAEYMIQYNGKDYGESLFASPEHALGYRDWSYVSIQQVSGLSGEYDSFHPYCDTVVDKIRERCPGAKLLIHRTWAYERGANHGEFVRYGNDTDRMAAAIGDAYKRLKDDVGAYAIIPVGEVIEILRAMPEFDVRVGGISLHRDGYHLSYGYGRFTAAAVWYQALGLGDIEKNSFTPSVEGEDDARLYDIIRKTVKKHVKPI